ncbi:hypothetical protein Clacol_009145 [Clathrus columnatus]|uniref:Glycoside hydrolase 131 catalytic N-terminal domain-containing protein n=1 Tax=Clathrus columnatus TaxID=1419009 RepID=A0AAV5APR0_9AGAM|nr:hypothetical protein Clacol_009145 [Clathrus columnatus]
MFFFLFPLIFPSVLALGNIKCPILFDGRVHKNVQPADFDKNSSIYDHQFVHGQNQTWAEIIKFPEGVPPSLFEISTNTKAVEVTINQNSIFVPGGDPPVPETGFRRSELIPALNNGTDITVQGTRTFHWSIRNDPTRPLNLSHEYHPVWHETADFSTSEITFLTGKPFNQSFDPTVHDPKTLRLAGRQSNSPETTFFQTPFLDDVWHNWAVTLGFETNLLTVYYSIGLEPLKLVAGPAFNNNSGGGQFHTGVFKLPTGPLGIDVLHQGFQESPINEGLIFGSIFIEDSNSGCVTLGN